MQKAECHLAQYHTKPDLYKLGHHFVEVPDINWLEWPRSSGIVQKGITLITRKKCWVIGRGSYKGKTRCKGSSGKPTGLQAAMWQKHRDNVNGAALRAAWRVSASQADARFVSGQKRENHADFDSKGHDWQEITVKWTSFNQKNKPGTKLITCKKWCIFYKAVPSYGSCRGCSRKITRRTRDKWFSLTRNPGVRKALCNAWKCSGANRWFRKGQLCKDGDIESHPGPRGCSLGVISIISGGCPGARRAVDEWLCSKPVVVLCV